MQDGRTDMVLHRKLRRTLCICLSYSSLLLRERMVWLQINNTEFSIAIVLGSGDDWLDMEVDLNHNVPFTYHNLSLVQGFGTTLLTCRHFTREAIICKYAQI